MVHKFERIWNDFSEILEISTIKDCSFAGSSQTYLIDSSKQAIDFNKVSEALVREKLNIKLKPKTLDCIYLDAGLLVLVEFTNSLNKQLDDIKLKIHDSLLLLNFLYNFDENDLRSIEIILVRKGNAAVASNQRSNNHLKNLADSSCPPSLKFLQKAYRIKISSMCQDEYLKRIR